MVNNEIKVAHLADEDLTKPKTVVFLEQSLLIFFFFYLKTKPAYCMCYTKPAVNEKAVLIFSVSITMNFAYSRSAGLQ